MRLKDLLHGVPVDAVEGSLDIDVRQVRDDSRAVEPGDLFVALPGQTVDGHDFLRMAAQRGAVAAIVEHAVGSDIFPGTRVVVASARLALAEAASLWYGEPSRTLRMVGITGTNGKTTTTYLVESMLRAGGRKVGVIGTVNYRYGDVVKPANFTTPTALELHAVLAEMLAAGCTHVVMEASSHALALDRLAGVRFRVGAFTNLTQDHLDFHGSMDAYFHAKARLMRSLLAPQDGVGVVLLDGEYGKRMATAVVGERLVLSVHNDGADVFAKRATSTIAGTEAELSSPLGVLRVRSRLVGEYNLANIIVAVGVALALGIDVAAMERGIAELRGVPGRLEPVDEAEARGFSVLVDYAHTHDALENVLAALRPLTKGRLLCVFGCGGDRDRTKRPRMGKVVARDADLAIVTSDNPRTEEPGFIIGQILDGVREVGTPQLGGASALAASHKGYWVEPDRRAAIEAAIAAAQQGDVVLIAGKGHEDYQIIGKTKHPFDDRAVARAAIARLPVPAGGAS